MPDPFPLHTPETAPDAAQSHLNAAQKSFGMIPNLEKVMASEPALLESYVTAWDAFDRTPLTPQERQVVYMTVNWENDCDYCVAWHTKLAKMARLDESEIQRLRDGASLSDPRLRALQHFTRRLLQTRGNPAPAELGAFLDAGYTTAHALAVVLGIAVKTMSNFTNGLAGTPLDSAVHDLAWTKPTLRARS